jgi:hypothetical protein
MSQITEWTFTSDAASTINELLKERPDLPFSRATVEERGTGNRKRRDLTIYDRNGQRVLTGEVKMPDRPDGRSPYADGLVNDAHAKADHEGVDYFFTWNVNRLVIWKTFEKHKPITQRDIEPLELASPIRFSDDLLHPRVKAQVRDFITIFLGRAAAILSGEAPIPYRPLDEKFIFIWEAALDPLVRETLLAITERYTLSRFRLRLDQWMRDDQGWTLSKDPDAINDNLERAAKFSCYVQANKIIFYKALRRRFKNMRALRIPPSIDTGKALHEFFLEQFEHAISISRDYQTVFLGDFGDTLPFLSDSAVDPWRMLNQDTDAFDFTEINYEIIGQIFERMLRGDERHRFGQHYTRSEIVDLINAFCIRTADAKVLDPACGGGTFLVRAYDRKKAVSGDQLEHEEEIEQLFGLDITLVQNRFLQSEIE